MLVEGAGGLMSPLSASDYNIDLAADLGLPLVIVAADELGTINATLQTLITAGAARTETTDRRNRAKPNPSEADESVATNQARVGRSQRRCLFWAVSNSGLNGSPKKSNGMTLVRHLVFRFRNGHRPDNRQILLNGNHPELRCNG